MKKRKSATKKQSARKKEKDSKLKGWSARKKVGCYIER